MIKMKTPPTEIMILYCCIISMFLYSEFSLYVKFIWSQALHKNLNIWASLSSSSLNQINVKDFFKISFRINIVNTKCLYIYFYKT